jgi:hypothetical protein
MEVKRMMPTRKIEMKISNLNSPKERVLDLQVLD